MNVDDILIARSRKKIGKGESRGSLTVGPGANSHPHRMRSMIAALTEGVRQCQLATTSRSASASRPISGQPLQRRIVTTFRANRYVNRAAGAIPAASTFKAACDVVAPGLEHIQFSNHAGRRS